MVKKVAKKYMNKNTNEYENYLDKKIKKIKSTTKKSLGFVIEKNPIKKEKKKLDKNRFKKKIHPISDKLSKKLDKINRNKVEISIKEDKNEGELSNIWVKEVAVKKTEKSEFNKELIEKKKKFLLPHDGQSINPQVESHLKLMETIVRNEYNNVNYKEMYENFKNSIRKRLSSAKNEYNYDKEDKLKEEIDDLKTKLKKKNIKKKEIDDLTIKLNSKEEKLQNISLNSMKKYYKDFLNQNLISKDNKKILNNYKEEVKEKINNGEMYITNDKKYLFNQPEIKMLEDLPDSLKNIEDNENFISNHYENLFKTGILKKSINKKHRKHLNKRKFKEYKINRILENKKDYLESKPEFIH